MKIAFHFCSVKKCRPFKIIFIRFNSFSQIVKWLQSTFIWIKLQFLIHYINTIIHVYLNRLCNKVVYGAFVSTCGVKMQLLWSSLHTLFNIIHCALFKDESWCEVGIELEHYLGKMEHCHILPAARAEFRTRDAMING